MHRKWVLARRPDGIPTSDDFRLEQSPMPEVKDGEVLIAVDHISIDPGMRSRLSRDSYAPALPIGSVIESAGIGTVLQSRNPKLAAGDLVSGGFGWQSHVLSPGRGIAKLDRTIYSGPIHPTAAIGVLGIPGLTAYFGLLETGQAKTGETVLISSAAGTVGATAGQIAKLMGLNVIGIAGGPDKCAYLRSLGFDAVIDRQVTRNMTAAIAEIAPKGLDIYFDNVGAETLDAAITNMKLRGRIVVSGQIAEYNADYPRGIRNTLDFIPKRLRMEGLVVFDFAARFAEAQTQLATWIKQNQLSYREQVINGLEHAPSAFIGLFHGRAHGRVLVKVD